MELIKCENLSLGYEGREVVGDLSFSVLSGEYLCVVGENGSGKSTLIKTLLGLLPPLSGHIKWAKDHRGIGYLPQQTAVQRDFPATAREIVLSGFSGKMRGRPFYKKAEKEAVRAIMTRLGIEQIAKKCYRELSGGQQQRVLLARALCAADSVLLLDEPTAGLDPLATAEFYKLVSELNRIDGITVIMVSHDIAAVAEYADHVLHIGKDLFFGTREAYLTAFGEAGGNI